jgi:hypothetical protein
MLMFLGIKLEGWLTIAAIVTGPILALLIQRWQDRRREDDKRRRLIFQQLLLTLKVPMAPRHVDAINSVPLEFYSDKGIFEAWRLYSSHLNDKVLLKNNSQRWGEKKSELLIDLAYKIGNSLGYDHLDKATLKDNIYVPQGYEDQETQFQALRTTLLQVLKGERPIPVTMLGPVQIEEPLKPAEELLTPAQQALLAPPTADTTE